MAGAVLLLVAVAMAAWALSGDSHRSSVSRATIRTEEDRFDSRGKRIVVERFEPDNPGAHPAVILLHGADGLDWAAAPVKYRLLATYLAQHGYTVLLVHYFQSTETRFSDYQTNARHFSTWVQVVADAVEHAKKLPSVDARRVGIVGVSLGAYLGLAEASGDPTIRAVVEFFGGIDDGIARQVTRMPPVLILHGDGDWIVPVSEARNLETFLKSRQLPFEIRIYPGQGHGFQGEALQDALRRMVGFLDRHLTPLE